MQGSTTRHAAVRRCGAPAGVTAALVALTMLASACGGSDEPTAVAAAPSSAATSTTTSTTTPATTVTTTSTTSTTTSTTTTTTSTTSTTTSTTTTTTVAATLPEQPSGPIAPPADENGREPVIELGRIAIPALGVDMTMYEGIRLTTLDRGPGHWPGTAMPGQAGNVVVAGHRVSKHRVFRNVDQLVAGDEIIFTDSTGEYVYIVNRVEVVNPDAIWIVDPTETPTATLFACHPPGSTRQRIVVFADLRV